MNMSKLIFENQLMQQFSILAGKWSVWGKSNYLFSWCRKTLEKFQHRSELKKERKKERKKPFCRLKIQTAFPYSGKYGSISHCIKSKTKYAECILCNSSYTKLKTKEE